MDNKIENYFINRVYRFYFENIEISSFFNKLNPRPKYVRQYSHPFFVIIMSVSGTVFVSVGNDREIVLSPREFTVIPFDIDHMVRLENEDTIGYCIALDFRKNELTEATDLYSELFHSLNILAYKNNSDTTTVEILQKCISDMREEKTHKIGVTLHSLIATIIDNFTAKPCTTDTKALSPDTAASRIHRINTVANVFYDNDVSIEDLASMLHLSVRQTGRIIENYYGMTWTALINEKRMMVAIDLIKNSEMSIECIAEYVGYNSVRGFYSAFKRRYGSSPGELRKS